MAGFRLINKKSKIYLFNEALNVLAFYKPDMFLMKNQNQMTNFPSVKYFSHIFPDRSSWFHLKPRLKLARGPSVKS